MLASVLGHKYGVQVRIGGDDAFTNGNIIQLPRLPLDCDETLLSLVRGMIDHEFAHICDTDFGALKAANLTSLEKYIWSIIEDWRIENVLSAIYPGCRENFKWLIRHFFLSKPKRQKQKTQQPDLAILILEWLLITVRSWGVAELDEEHDYLKAAVENYYSGLTQKIEPCLQRIKIRCGSTLEIIDSACEIANIITKYFKLMEQSQCKQQARPNKEAIMCPSYSHY